MIAVGGKVLIGALVSLGTVASSLGIHYLLTSPKTLGDLLSQSGGFKLLGENDSKWTELLNKYKTTSESPSKIKDFNLENNQENVQSLKDQCQALWNTKLSQLSSNDQNRKMTEIKTWCIESAIALTSSK